MNNQNTVPHVSIDFVPVDSLDAQIGQPLSPPVKAPAAPVMTIPFSIKAMGYDLEQVDLYLQKLMGEYSHLQQSYSDLSTKYYQLAKQPGANMEVIAKALVDAEAAAAKIIAAAKAEAAGIVQRARQDLTVIHNEGTRLKTDIGAFVSRLQSLGVSA